MSSTWRYLLAALGVIVGVFDDAVLHASCDVLPSPPSTFRSALGSTDRPFAGGGDWLTIGLDARCDGASAGFTAESNAHVVTVAFRAPAGGANLVVLADDCALAAQEVDACRSQPGLQSITCMRARHDVATPSGGLTEIEDIVKLDERHLRFRFPDTDALLGAPSDDLGFAGPAALAVTELGTALPCDLGTAPCAGRTGLLACVDAIYADDGSCAPTPDAIFPSFVALPPPNDFEAICEPEAPPSTSPCDGTIDEIRFTIDTAGNMLIPIDWRGVLFKKDLVPVLRLVRGTSAVESYPGRGAPIRIPDLSALKSFSPGGKSLPPLFDPLRDEAASGPVTFFGSADAPQTVLRIARHDGVVRQCAGGGDAGLPCLDDAQCPGSSCTPARCVGGSNAVNLCTSDADCPAGECGPGLYDFSTRAALASGPVLLRRGTCLGGADALAACADDAACPGGQCVDFTLTALDPVPLDGLQQSETVNAFVLEEALENRDLNGDGDAVDHVVRLGDRATGATIPIGDAGAEALAVTRIQQPPFSFPAVAVGGELLAFLEPEPLQAAFDLNGDGDVADTILRAFRLDGTEVTAGHPPIVADGAPLVNGRPIAIANGRAFFRSVEAAGAQQALDHVNVTPSGDWSSGGAALGDISADGRYVAFWSDATDLVAGVTSGATHVYVRDRVAGATELVSVSSAGEPQNGYAAYPSISSDGRYVTFASNATNLGPVHSFGGSNTFVHDRVTGRTELASIGSNGQRGNGDSSGGDVSADGRFVVIGSYATNLVPGDTNGSHDLFVRDRVAGTMQRVSVGTGGAQAIRESFGGWISDDGRYVAFNSFARNLVPNDTNGISDVPRTDDPGSDIFIRDLLLQTTERVNLDAAGDPSIGYAAHPILSGDGRAVTFASLAPLVPGDTNAQWDIFVRNLDAKVTTRASVDSSGRQAEDYTGDNWDATTFISGDGRSVVFTSRSSRLVEGDTDGRVDLFRHDTVTQLTTSITQGFPPHVADYNAAWPYGITDDGSSIAFYTKGDIVPGDPNGAEDIFVLGSDPTDCASDLTGDCDHSDTVLRVLDESSGALQTLCPATQVAVSASGSAAFLRPEASGDAPGCPALPLNDADAADADRVVQLFDGTSVHNLGRAATAVAMSDAWIGALVSEAAQDGTNYNSDGDATDTVAQVHSATAPGAGWVNLGQAADRIDVNGGLVAFLTPEVAQNDVSLNGDGDAADRVLQVFDAEHASPVVNTTRAAEDFVLGAGGIAAFRTREASQGNGGGTDLNGDGDRDDHVLHVYDASMQGVLSTHQAVTPCNLEACDPRTPYRVLADTVTFLTFEGDQQEDLNVDGDQTDLVLQVFNVRQATMTGDVEGARHVLAATTAGVCTATGAACASDADCNGGICFLPPGGCIHDVGTACVPATSPLAPDPVPCTGLDEFCQPLLAFPGHGLCQKLVGACATNDECAPGDRCNLDADAFNRIVSPLLEPGGGGTVFAGSGRCIENLGRACAEHADCESGEFCSGGACQREHGSCASDAECPPATTCVADLALQTAADSDADELPDIIDNCPTVANIEQDDGDRDGRGDACDAQTCGNDVREATEACDGSDAAACPGTCTDDCVCPCEDLVTGAKVKIRRSKGILTARLRIPLVAYAGEAVNARLADADGVIVTRNVGALAPVGRSGKSWKFHSKAAGLQSIRLKKGSARNPGLFTATVGAKGWFDAASADGTAAETTFTLSIGGRCFATHLSAEPR